MRGPSQADPAGSSALLPATVRVWDPVVRLFHWSLVGLFAVAWLSGDELQSLHEAAGYAIAGLLALRVVWGLVGTRHARFSDFLYRPATVVRFLADTARGRARRYIGHNPAGGVMILALIGVLASLCATGVLMTTDLFWGVSWVEELHEGLANAALLLVGLHLAGVGIASLEHRENLVRSMITGRKRV
ncbi:cytochrome b/b6 domain-containing protein [Pannonibacter tanglangensis]|uniref:Cytochrome B n=1 Tax=Pannonibacter tanglangensis TaxID=2750084 RepID=A0ABW9ZDM4_9HYPH|nr:cytochrome b/b6 domain-containing protein [Pannonibacter sp. XCT-34]NBN62937.1 cytochrome B [Pannonibacter sp. XCT-34]